MRLLRIALVTLCVLAGCGLVASGAILSWLLLGQSLDAARQRQRVAALRLRAAGPEHPRATSGVPTDGNVPLHRLQLLATHNSYRLGGDTLGLFLIGLRQPSDAVKLRYGHLPLYDQLELGLRSFELDVRNRGTGFVIKHIPMVDARSACPDFGLALEELQLWSAAHPAHVPIVVLLELKHDWSFLDPRLVDFDGAALQRLDAEIRRVFPAQQLLTPDDVRGESPTLLQAIRERGWPLLHKVRGRLMFVLHEDEQYRQLFIAGNPTLAGRALFTCAPPGQPDAAIRIVNDPVAEREQIARLVQQGYLIRTRADTDLAINPAQTAAALDSGAQIVSTDFPPAEPRTPQGTGYVCAFAEERTVRVRTAP